MHIGLIATDLDGTFLSRDGSIPEANRQAVLHAAALGIPIVFATGRPVRFVKVLDSLVGGHPHVIVSNGAGIYDLQSRQMLQIHPLDAAAMLGFAERLSKVVPDVSFALEYPDGWGREPTFPLREKFAEADVVAPLTELVNDGRGIKFLARSQAVDTDTLAVLGGPLTGPDLTCTYSFVSPHGLLELSVSGVSKATTLASIMAELGVPADEVVAFGDMPNDLDMLRLAGHGYVMANGHATMMHVGLPIAGHHEDAAVGRVIEDLLAQ